HGCPRRCFPHAARLPHTSAAIRRLSVLHNVPCAATREDDVCGSCCIADRVTNAVRRWPGRCPPPACSLADELPARCAPTHIHTRHAVTHHQGRGLRQPTGACGVRTRRLPNVSSE